jgi:hypothetical protein
LCIGCVEVRLWRELLPADFSDFPINQMSERHSDRLRSRLAGKTFAMTIAETQAKYFAERNERWARYIRLLESRKPVSRRPEIAEQVAFDFLR